MTSDNGPARTNATEKSQNAPAQAAATAPAHRPHPAPVSVKAPNAGATRARLHLAVPGSGVLVGPPRDLVPDLRHATIGAVPPPATDHV